MLFNRYSALPPKYLSGRGAIDKTEICLVKALPQKKVYTFDELAKIVGSKVFPPADIIEALVVTGVLELQEAHICPDTGFRDADSWDDGTENYVIDIRYVVKGSLMNLINSFKTEKDASPYFISFYWDEGLEHARALHTVLSEAGIPGYMCVDMTTGTPFKRAITRTLQSANTVIFIETPNYHLRPACRLERDFAIAKGTRIMRIGTCSHSELNDVPTWLNGNIQHEDFMVNGNLDITQRILGVDLPPHLDLTIRRDGIRELIQRLTPDKLMLLATAMGLQDQLDGSPLARQSSFCSLVCMVDTSANDFCSRYDIASML